jgi:chromosome segregation ATPase
MSAIGRGRPATGKTMISKLRLQNVKNFRDATLPLGKLTVLVGTNASGETNLIDAFRFLHGVGRGNTLADVIGGMTAEERSAKGGQTVIVVGNRGERKTFPWGYFKFWTLDADLARFEKI